MQKVGPILALSMTVALFVGCGHNSHPAAKSELDKAIAATETGDIDLALACLNAAIQLDPRNAEALSRRAVIHHTKHHNEAALQDASESIHQDSTSWRAYIVRGWLYGKEDRAEVEFELAVKHCPAGEWRPIFWRGYHFLNVGALAKAKVDFDALAKAKADFDEASARAPGVSLPYYMRGCVHFKKCAFDLAIADFGRAIANESVEKDGAGAYLQRGLAFLELDKPAAAKADFEKAKALGCPDVSTAFDFLEQYEFSHPQAGGRLGQ